METREKITDALISTRDGKVNSIVKIVRAESASMKTGEVSQEDRMEVMLSGIMSEIKEIRNATDRNSYLKNYETTVYPENSIFKIENVNNLEKAKILQTKEKGYTEKFLVELKQGVTIKEINNALNRIKSRGINIQQIRNERKLIVEVIDSNLEGDRLIKIMDILEELGEVWPII